MTSSAYHLFNDIYQRRKNLLSAELAAENFMLRDDLIACRGSPGRFPDMVLRTNPNNPIFHGGEFIEIKDAKKGYSIASFNSTIPSAYKNTREYITLNGAAYKQIQESGEQDPYLLEEREVYYLIRGYKKPNYKVCLVQGGFFETMSVRENIKSALKDALHDAMQDSNLKNDADAMDATNTVLDFDWKREHFSKVKKNKRSSISIRMRIMSEVLKEANVLDENQYPAITDNTLNMIVSGHSEQNYQEMQEDTVTKMSIAFGYDPCCLPVDLKVKKLKHLRNGPFVLFQTAI